MTSIETPAKLNTRAVTVTALFAQLSLLVTTPLATRLVDVGDFSDYQVALSIAAVMQLFFSGGIEYLLPAVAGEKVRMLRLRGYRFLGWGVFAVMVIDGGLLLAGNTRLATVVAGSAVIALVYAYTALDSAYRANLGGLRIVATRNLTFGLVVVALQMVVIFFWPTFEGLVAAVLVARVTSIALSLLVNAKLVPTAGEIAASGGDTHRTTGLTQNFAWLAGVSASTVAVQAPVLIIGLYSLDLAGPFALALRIVGLPAAIVGSAVSQGYALRLAKSLREGRSSTAIRAMIVAVQRRWLVAGVASGVLMAVTAPFLAPLILGDSWTSAGHYIMLLAVPFGVQLVNRIVTPTYPLLGRNGTLVWLQSVRFVVVAGATGLLLWLTADLDWTAIAMGVASGLFFIAAYLVTPRLVPEDPQAIQDVALAAGRTDGV